MAIIKEFPKGTPLNVIRGKSHFINDELMIKAIGETNMSASQISRAVFTDRGKGHAMNKVNDWIKYRYPAMDDDLTAVLRYIDPFHHYDWKDFQFDDYDSKKYQRILGAYKGYQNQKRLGADRSKARFNAETKGLDVSKQEKLF